MKIGYACIGLGIPDVNFQTLTMKNANKKRLGEVISHNLLSLKNLAEYNGKEGIQLFRITSDLIPFGSSLVNNLNWQEMYKEELIKIGDCFKKFNIRVSMHPGQYTVLNSPKSDVVERGVKDLRYHCDVLNALGVNSKNKIILHIGGIYGDKKEAIKRFAHVYNQLEEDIKERLVIENDDRSYHIEDVLEIGIKKEIPVVFDVLHHEVLPGPSGRNAIFWIQECSRTWNKRDGNQKIHYSQQNPQRQKGAHSETIYLPKYLEFQNEIKEVVPDVMLEVKDKNLSAVKCLNCQKFRLYIKNLEKEWGKYKYNVLERSPETYIEIRKLLKDKSKYPIIEFYDLIQLALSKEGDSGHVVNAALHVWGYFKDVSTNEEKNIFFKKVERFEKGNTSIQPVKKYLWSLTGKYQEEYLKQSYYFWF